MPSNTETTSSTKLKVPFHHCDPMGVVWHGRYFEYFELARCELLARYDLDILDVQELGYRVLITESNCRHTYPLSLGDEFEVRATITETSPQLRICYRVTNLTQSRASARGFTTLAALTRDGGLLTKPPAEFAARLPDLPRKAKRRLASTATALCIALLCGLGAGSAHAEPPVKKSAAKKVPKQTLSTLLQGFADMPGLEASFVEEKHLALLVSPLKSEGTLQFTAPGFLRRTVNSPRMSSVVVTPTTAQILSNGKLQTIKLLERKDIGALVQSLTWILAGNQQAIEQDFTVVLAQQSSGWRLTMTPKRKPLTELISRIVLDGSGPAVRTVKVLETNGDYSVTTILAANPRRLFTAEEKRRLFNLAHK